MHFLPRSLWQSVRRIIDYNRSRLNPAGVLCQVAARHARMAA